MKVLVAGGTGQLGRALVRRGRDVVALDEVQLDITDDDAIARALEQRPDVLINAAAYTAVDKAESERDRAFAVNADGPEKLGRACRERGIAMLHVSTDYVFDGTATAPYPVDATIAPQNVYGASKADGERRLRAVHPSATIVRTSWLFEQRGPSFVHTMLRLAGERPVLRVVSDQVGCPTWADDLADALLVLAERGVTGEMLHYCNDGVTSWHGFATAIIDEARRHKALPCERIDAITTAEFPTPAKRPAYSVLDTSRIRALGITPPSWRPGLEQVVAEVLRS